MDKYEYKLKADEIVRLAGKKKYEAAAKIADEIRWEKVKNIQMLCTVSEIYEQIGKYEESIEVLLQAQHRSPNAKMIVYKLVELYIEAKDYQEATAYYHEYMQLAPNDSNALPLKYKLYKARGAKLETQIAILEEFKAQDFQEEWILELARLYHQAGQGDKCVELCDEIDLWFNSGEMVMRALELKRIYQPLTLLQEQKLADRNHFSYEETVLFEETDEADVQQSYEAQPEYEVQPESAAQPEYEVQPEPAAQPEYEVQPEPAAQQTAEEPAAAGMHETVRKSPESETLTGVESVAEAIIRMARPEPPKGEELQPGFSILPKGDVVKADADDFAFSLPEGVEKTELLDELKKAEEAQVSEADKADDAITAPAGEMTEIFDKEDALEQEEAEKISEELPEEELQEETEQESVSEESLEDEAKEDEEKPKGLFGKMISRLKMEDDEMDDDFNDDYDDSDEFIDEDEPKFKRGLTDQYEKIEMEEDEDENDPLNVRLTASIPDPDEEEEEYEYAYDEDDEYDEYDEYEALEDEADDGNEEEEDSRSRGSKRFRFFRSTMEDDEMYEDEAEEDVEPQEEQVIPLSYATKYDTLNLQKELAKSIQQLMDATEKETVDSTLENVKKMVERSNIPELTETMRFRAIRGNMLNSVAKRQAEKLQQAKDIEEVVRDNARYAQAEPAEDATVSKADARPKPAVELAIKLKPTNEEEEVPIENILTQENDGQLSLIMPEEEMVEKQITGQLNIEDVLKEWEKQEFLSESDREKRALEEARKRALEETQGIMSEIMGLLKDVIPKIGAIKDGEEKMSVLAESLERVQKSLPFTQGIVDAAEKSKVAASAIEAACAEAVLELEKMENSSEEKAAQGDAPTDAEKTAREDASEEAEMAEDGPMPDLKEAFEEMEHSLQEEKEEELKEAQIDNREYLKEQMALLYTERTPIISEEMLAAAKEDAESGSADSEESQPEEEAVSLETQETDLEEAQPEEEPDYEEAVQEDEVSEELAPDIQKSMDEILAEEVAGMMKEQEQNQEESDDLNEEQKDILAYFLAIGSLKDILKRIVKRTEYAPEHMIITGEAGSGKTSVAMRIIKAAQVNKEEKIETIAKIKADLLNQKQITEIFSKVNGGVLIIENAGNLKPTTVYAIEEALYSNEYYVQIILADRKEAIAKLLSTTRSFLNDIQMRVDLPVYNNNELVEFARTYAEVNGYTFDGMALLALHSVIDLFQSDDHVTNLDDMKNIMDEAMERADRRNKKLFGKLFGKKNSEGIVLVESDFE